MPVGSKISELAASSAFVATMQIPVNNAGTTERVTGTQLATYLGGGAALLAASGTAALLQLAGKVALAADSTTLERGMVVRMINRTGGVSIKGTLVAASTATDREVIKQATEFDTIGVVQEAGVAEGSEMWVWMPGSVCQVLFKDTVAATRGNVLIAADTDGRAIDVAVPSANPVVAEHFKECGHVMESKGAGVGVLVLAAIHFN